MRRTAASSARHLGQPRHFVRAAREERHGRETQRQALGSAWSADDAARPGGPARAPAPRRAERAQQGQRAAAQHDRGGPPGGSRQPVRGVEHHGRAGAGRPRPVYPGHLGVVRVRRRAPCRLRPYRQPSAAAVSVPSERGRAQPASKRRCCTRWARMRRRLPSGRPPRPGWASRRSPARTRNCRAAMADGHRADHGGQPGGEPEPGTDAARGQPGRAAAARARPPPPRSRRSAVRASPGPPLRQPGR